MLSIFVETSCNRYNRDECVSCHVYEPLMEHPVSEWHLSVQQAKVTVSYTHLRAHET